MIVPILQIVINTERALPDRLIYSYESGKPDDYAAIASYLEWIHLER